jgi:hypothetical protein
VRQAKKLCPAAPGSPRWDGDYGRAVLHHERVRGDRAAGHAPPRPPKHRANRAGPLERKSTSPPALPKGGHGQPSADVAAGPAGPRARRTARNSNRGLGGPDPGPRAPGCGAARHGPRAGARPPAAAPRARGAETGRPEKAGPSPYWRDKETRYEASIIIHRAPPAPRPRHPTATGRPAGSAWPRGGDGGPASRRRCRTGSVGAARPWGQAGYRFQAAR